MRGDDIQQNDLFSYGSLEERVPESHPLRPIRQMVDEALKQIERPVRRDLWFRRIARRLLPSDSCALCFCSCCIRCAVSAC